MSSYVESLLGANEKVLVREHQHWSFWVPQLIGSLVIIAIIAAASFLISQLPNLSVVRFGLVFVVIPIIAFVRVYLAWATEEYMVTNRRIVQTEGVINKSVMDSSLEKINDVVLTQSVIGRMLDYGDLEILTGSDYGINKLHRIQSPVKFKIAMLNAKESMRDASDTGMASPAARLAADRDIPALIQELAELHEKGLITDAEFQTKRAKLMNEI